MKNKDSSSERKEGERRKESVKGRPTVTSRFLQRGKKAFNIHHETLSFFYILIMPQKYVVHMVLKNCLLQCFYFQCKFRHLVIQLFDTYFLVVCGVCNSVMYLSA